MWRLIGILIRVLGPKALEEVAKALGYQDMVRLEVGRIETAGLYGPRWVEDYPAVVFTKGPGSWGVFTTVPLGTKLEELSRTIEKLSWGIDRARSLGLRSTERFDMERFPKVRSVFVDWREL